MRIVFAGTPEFAVPTLEALLRSRHTVALVITQPDRPAGRGRAPHPPPVKLVAQRSGVPVLQPASVNAEDTLAAVRAADPDALVVVAYGGRLGARILAIPRRGCFNVHASLLPRYRGAAPVHHAILHGDSETGITIQRMAARIDTGPIVAQRPAYIYDEDTTGDLMARLGALAGDLIAPTMDAVEDGAAVEQPQDSAQATLAPRLSKSDGWIPWDLPAARLINFIRAMTPWPGAFALHAPLDGRRERRVTVLAARMGPERRLARRRIVPGATPGKIVIAHKTLAVATGDGLITLLRLTPDGSKPMDAESFLRGYRVQVGDYFRAPE